MPFGSDADDRNNIHLPTHMDGPSPYSEGSSEFGLHDDGAGGITLHQGQAWWAPTSANPRLQAMCWGTLLFVPKNSEILPAGTLEHTPNALTAQWDTVVLRPLLYSTTKFVNALPTIRLVPTAIIYQGVDEAALRTAISNDATTGPLHDAIAEMLGVTSSDPPDTFGLRLNAWLDTFFQDPPAADVGAYFVPGGFSLGPPAAPSAEYPAGLPARTSPEDTWSFSFLQVVAESKRLVMPAMLHYAMKPSGWNSAPGGFEEHVRGNIVSYVEGSLPAVDVNVNVNGGTERPDNPDTVLYLNRTGDATKKTLATTSFVSHGSAGPPAAGTPLGQTLLVHGQLPDGAYEAHTEDYSIYERAASGSDFTAPATNPIPVTLDLRDLYGGKLLQMGDRDGSSARYEGSSSPNKHYVQNLVEDLKRCGIDMLKGSGRPAHTFHRPLEWGVREFQIYAGMTRTAILAPAPGTIADRLIGVANDMQRTGPISGVVDAETRSKMAIWRHRGWHVPVVVEARRDATPYVIDADDSHDRKRMNIWHHKAVRNTSFRMFVRDVTGRIPLTTDPPNGLPSATARTGDLTDGAATTTRFVLGYYEPKMSGGPGMELAHSWEETELSTTNLDPTGASVPTAMEPVLLAIRHGSQGESGGRFDMLNCWDGVHMSVPLFHHVLGRQGHDAELPALLALLEARNPTLFTEAVGRFGLYPEESWSSAAGMRVQGVYRTQPQHDRIQGTSVSRQTLVEADYDYYRTWHWVWRMVLAGRWADHWGPAPWWRETVFRLARLRLRNLMNATWPTGSNAPTPHSDWPAGAGTKLGDLVKSTKGWAALMKWHAKFPSDIVDGATPTITVGVAQRLQHVHGDPATWTAATEEHEIEGRLRARLTQVRGGANHLKLRQAFDAAYNEAELTYDRTLTVDVVNGAAGSSWDISAEP